MSDRFFVETPIEGGGAVLTGAEAHHLLHVMRGRPGDEVVLFDGGGCEYGARIERCGRREVECAVLTKREVDRELTFDLTLAVALPKGERQRWLVEKLVELGVSKSVPLVTERSVAQPSNQALDRLRRVVIEASKQCGRNVLMEIAAPQPWMPLVISTAELSHSAESVVRCVVAHPGGDALALDKNRVRQNMVVAIGPEGGFTDEEITAAQSAGWKVVDLGPRVLRVETAAILLATHVVLGGM